jgi:hypothetical protein
VQSLLPLFTDNAMSCLKSHHVQLLHRAVRPTPAGILTAHPLLPHAEIALRNGG